MLKQEGIWTAGWPRLSSAPSSCPRAGRARTLDGDDDALRAGVHAGPKGQKAQRSWLLEVPARCAGRLGCRCLPAKVASLPLGPTGQWDPALMSGVRRSPCQGAACLAGLVVKSLSPNLMPSFAGRGPLLQPAYNSRAHAKSTMSRRRHKSDIGRAIALHRSLPSRSNSSYKSPWMPRRIHSPSRA